MESSPSTSSKETLSHNSALISSFAHNHRSTTYGDAERDFLNYVVGIAESAGCVFLFEVPGALFAQPECRAAAITHQKSLDATQRTFVLSNLETGIVKVLSEQEVDEKVMRFIDSYTKVLSSLKTVEPQNSLH